ncbi:hypothetical protein [Croceicoccus sp. Ery15]|uniref:hypothetical protein n=1 Tax=Croceicoccus sp. Ery15 TaxID=1703338 RepID=UPI001E3F6DBC|nr:hypothetical protein [Croceicoccus sp. Ery15]
MSIREHRVTAFCDWLDTIPPSPPFHTRSEFRFYRDLSDVEMRAAQVEMERRALLALAEADALEAEVTMRREVDNG